MEKCIACGLCSEKCPKKVPDEYDAGLRDRRAIYVKYAQAVPLKYAIDGTQCIFLTKGKCGACKKICPTGAINYDDKLKEMTLKVGAVIMANGCETYDPKTHDTYGYGKLPNVITSLEFERILSASGPCGGHLVRPSDEKEPKKIAWLQCIGSRDQHIGARGYCSSVCCTYAIKEAMLAKEHSKEPLDAVIFYMDIRAHGKDFEKYYNHAKDESGVRFVKSKVTNIIPVENDELMIRYLDETGRRKEEKFDIVILSVGLGVKKSAVELAASFGVNTDQYGFAVTNSFEPIKTSRSGIYVCGSFEAPKDIPSSVIEAGASAGAAGSSLVDARWGLTRTKEIPVEIDTRGEPPRIGVFVCCCGTNIAGVVDVPKTVEYVKTLDNVVFAEKNTFSCSSDSLNNMAKTIKEHRLNRVVVAACTPKTHEPVFQETLTGAGLNKYVFEMANIRNQCSWVHKNSPELATKKAIDLVGSAVAKARLLEPLNEVALEVNQKAMVIGGGIAGITSAKTLSNQGYNVYLIEKNDRLGGQALSIHETWDGADVQQNLTRMIAEVEADKNISIYTGAQIVKTDGFVGNFKTTIKIGDRTEELTHGVVIIASGATELKPDQYLYGQDKGVLTALELDKRLINEDMELANTKSALFIQCVGSRIPERPYCSKVCCTHAVKNALTLKKLNPQMDVRILYRDMRTYGLREDLYREAREKGIIFLRYNPDQGLTVDKVGDEICVSFIDTGIRRKLLIKPDLLVLVTAITPPLENPLSQQYKATLNDDGFFMEAHAKLRPVDCATDGVFICGLAHAPKPIDESITQAVAASTRAVALLASKTVFTSGTIAEVVPTTCSGCGVCTSICPYSAPSLIDMSERMFPGKAKINPALCKGCGLCVSSCRSGAIRLKGFDTDQIFAQICAL
jgi:heterodisulfide reductase subunit A2